MNILIVDDEADSLAEIEWYIKKYGGFEQYAICGNSVEALEKCEKTSFHIALLDIEMPQMSGIELAEKLSGLFPEINIVFITAYNHFATEAFELNAIDYILKPIREERLFKTFDKLKAGNLHAIEKNIEEELSISMFGKFAVRIGGNLLKWNRQKSAELFAYLLENHGQAVHKEKLCELLWPDSEPKKALINLQTSIHAVRKTLLLNCGEKIKIEYAGNNYTLQLKSAR